MRIQLFTICVLVSTAFAEGRPIYWQYPGPFAERLEAAFADVKTKRDQHHLISESDRRAFLKKSIKRPIRENCLEDQAVCGTEALGILDALGLDGRILARAKRTQIGYEITLLQESKKHQSVRTVTAEASGPLSQAAREALNALHGQGTLSLSLTPNDAFFFLNDQPYGQGSGDHLITSGSHTLKVQAPGFKSETMEVEVKTGERVRVRIELVAAAAIISLVTTPDGADVYLDGERWENPEQERSLTAGKRLLRVEKEGYQRFEQTLLLKPSSISALKLKLVPSDPPWRQALKSQVSDTTAMPMFIRGGFSGISIRDRKHELDTNLSTLESVNEPMGGQNFGFAVSLRKDSMLIDVLRIDYSTAAGPVRARMKNFGDVEVTDLSRLTIAPLWLGYQHEIWRLVPYGVGGLAISSETINGRNGASEFRGEQTELKVGAELGIRYVFNPHLFVGLAHQIEGFPGQGAHFGIGLQIGYAFNIPQKLKEFIP